jgi:molybdenum cofactor cytidylyltransferase
MCGCAARLGPLQHLRDYTGAMLQLHSPDSEPIKYQPGQPVVLVLAGGKGQRFLASGGQVHKLQASLAGRSVLSQTVARATAAELPCLVVQPSAAQPRMGDSIAAGVAATPLASAWLVLPGDMPGVAPQTLRRVIAALAQGPDPLGPQAARPHCFGRLGHPVGFRAELREKLLALGGAAGAAAVWRSCRASEIDIADAGCVMDIDTLTDLATMAAYLAANNLGCE